MENEKDILADWKLRKKPEVPEGFFDRFVDDLMVRIESESGILSQLKKSKKPEVPEGFFDSIMAGIDEQTTKESVSETGVLEELKLTSKPVLPTGYFEDFENRLMDKIENEGKRGRVIPMRIITTVISIAAVFAIIFTVVDFNDNPNDSEAMAGIENELKEEAYDDYIAYMDEDELIDYIIENDIETEDTTNTVDYDEYSDFSEDELLDYYLDL